jgi:hypothetical protein
VQKEEVTKKNSSWLGADLFLVVLLEDKCNYLVESSGWNGSKGFGGFSLLFRTVAGSQNNQCKQGKNDLFHCCGFKVYKQQVMKYCTLIGSGLFLSFIHYQKITIMTFLFLFGGGIIITLLVVLFIFLLPLLALISALMSDFPGNEKILWVLIILLLPFLGSVLYFLIGRNQRISR